MYTSANLASAMLWSSVYSTVIVMIALYLVERRIQSLFEDVKEDEEEAEEARNRFLERLGGRPAKEEQVELSTDERGIIAEFTNADGVDFYLALMPKEEFEKSWEAHHGN